MHPPLPPVVNGLWIAPVLDSLVATAKYLVPESRHLQCGVVTPPPLADADLGNAIQPVSPLLVSEIQSSAEQSANTGRVAGSNVQRGEQPALTFHSIADVNQLLKGLRHWVDTLLN